MNRRILTVVLAVTVVSSGWGRADDFKLLLRQRKATQAGYKISLGPQNWKPQETAVVVCDMWDLHHCLNATRRVVEMAPRMNRLLIHARKSGALIIHAPSSCTKTYENHPARLRAQRAPRADNLPKDIGQWCNRIPSESRGQYPIDQSDGGEDDDPEEHKAWAKKLAAMGRNPRAPWKSQYKVLEIRDEDVISDNGEEIWNVMEQRGIKNVMLVGVHTNMCVLGRPFGLRQMAKNGKNVVLVRDMTDTMYNPRRWPYVSHFQGTDLIVEHIEKFVCPTILSGQLIGGKTFRFKNDRRPKAVVVLAERLYKTDVTLSQFAAATLRDRLGFRIAVLKADTKNRHLVPGLAKALDGADLLVLSARRRALPRRDLEAVRKYLSAGKPLVALRTSSHAFDAKGNHPSGHAEWKGFDKEVLGGNYHGHYADGPVAAITAAGKAGGELLQGITLPMPSKGSLYKSRPLEKKAVALLNGTIDGHPSEPVAWTNEYQGGRVFYTSLGHPSDFANPGFVRLLENGVRWASRMKIREK